MVYLDYSATTPVNPEVLKTFDKVSLEYPGNANSLHELGSKSADLMNASVKQIADILKVNSDEIILTSGASEANNLAILGTILKYRNRGKHILTTKLEHSSVSETVKFLESFGYTIEYLNLLPNGKIDLEDLKNKLTNETVLVSICQVNSEIGIIQDVNQIGEILKEYPRVIFHVDGTQAVGKIKVDLTNIDLYSFSGHKIYGLKGIGCLVKKRGIELVPIIHGGKSQTIYRSGTPMPALYASFAKALRLIYTDFDSKYSHIVKLHDFLINELLKIDLIHVNSNENCIPQIINFSIQGIKPETMLHALSEKDIYISTKTACSEDNSLSESVLALTKNKDLAKSSLRISLSYLTTEEEIKYFLKVLQEKIKELSFQKGE
ncbi:MAG: cysteine desulfurase family protein [Bacilli bacterium]